MKKIAVILSGCGVYDGAEIYESVITLLHLAERQVEYQCMAPNIQQMHVINHLTGEEASNESRNVLVESARLARGEIIDLAVANAEDYAGLIIPGGFGAVKNLCDFAVKGAQAEINSDVLSFAQSVHKAGKPVGLICIAPAMTGLIFGEGASCTIGNDIDTAAAIEATGAKHQNCPVEDTVVDQQRKIVTTPAYMLAGSITEAAQGISKLVDQVIDMAIT